MGLTWAAAWILVGALGAVPPKAQTPSAFQRGVALGLFSARDDWDYSPLLDELVAHGATDVELVVVWCQETMQSTVIEAHPNCAPSVEALRRTIRQARQRGLRVLVFPLVRIEVRQAGEWRGKIEFSHGETADAWWRSYRDFLLTMARAAQEEHAERLSVGSELLKLEKERARWEEVIQSVRAVYGGRLMYSANWDHFDGVTFWDLLDEVGLTAYFELTQKDEPTVGEISAAWSRWSPSLRAFSRSVGKPIIFTEVGYPSLRGANRFPWDETRKAPLSVEEQRRCYRAFVDGVGRAPFVGGAYFWNWFGNGGPGDGDYTPRGKPAAAEMKAYFDKR